MSETCSHVNAIEGKEKEVCNAVGGVWGLPASGGSSRVGVELGKARVCAARDSGSLAVRLN